jgi:hypothetical protein
MQASEEKTLQNVEGSVSDPHSMGSWIRIRCGSGSRRVKSAQKKKKLKSEDQKKYEN